jgi:hypothetical protein
VLRVLLEPVSAAGSTKSSILMHTSVVEEEQWRSDLSADTRVIFVLNWERFVRSREVDGCEGGGGVSQSRVGERFIAVSSEY